MEGPALNIIYECDECVVCLEQPPTSVFAPCRHRCCCTPCSELIEKSKQPCPLCRTPISDVYVYKDRKAVEDVVLSIDPNDIEVFKNERREEYVKSLKISVTGDACFKGKGKLARSVAAEAGSEMEMRQRETAGTERVTTKPSTIQFTVKGHDLYIDYKCGRSKRQENVWEGTECQCWILQHTTRNITG